MVNKKPYSG